jgi:transposase
MNAVSEHSAPGDLSREQAIAEARRLAGEGLSERQIGARMGVTGSCIHRWLNPKKARAQARVDNQRRRAAKRAWEKAPEQRARCRLCGAALGTDSRRRGYRWCRAHYELYERLCRAARRAVIAQMWQRGASLKTIATRLGSTPNSIGTEVTHMRRDGWALAYRRPRNAP